MQGIVRNLSRRLPDASASEVIDTVISARGVRLERIVSHGQASPDGFWYDQDEAEWVLVVSGKACLEIEGQAGDHVLAEGDSIFLPAHCRHRVTWTDPARPTIWIAVFIDPGLAPIAHDLG
jgi:cupin 2 domain-containing protein